MGVDNFLKNLKLDLWYMIFVYIGVLGFLFSLVFPIQSISNRQAMFLSLGFLLIGLGEWKNHKVYASFKEANAYTGDPGLIQTLIRKADFIGNLMLFIGIILVILSFLDIIKIINIFI